MGDTAMEQYAYFSSIVGEIQTNCEERYCSGGCHLYRKSRLWRSAMNFGKAPGMGLFFEVKGERLLAVFC
jgi:hypothetical protein